MLFECWYCFNVNDYIRLKAINVSLFRVEWNIEMPSQIQISKIKRIIIIIILAVSLVSN